MGSIDSQTKGRGSRLAHSAASTVLPYPAGAQMATTGVAAEASSQSRSRPLDTSPGRVGAGVSFDSTMENDGAAGVGAHGWIGMVGLLRIMTFSGQLRLADQVASSPGVGRSNTPDRVGDIGTEERGYNQATKHTSP